tara:strand:+ start:8102 stop:8527 length:426 start_codon:yes stop_codon:yes gene_type:complete
MPQSINITIGSDINSSLSIGDIAYKANLGAAAGGFKSADNDDIVKLGNVTHIHRKPVSVFSLNGSNVSVLANTITVNVGDDVIGGNSLVPTNKAMLLFSKDNKVNSTGLKGYYAEVKFQNTDTTKTAELFSVGSEVALSSK